MSSLVLPILILSAVIMVLVLVRMEDKNRLKFNLSCSVCFWNHMLINTGADLKKA